MTTKTRAATRYLLLEQWQSLWQALVWGLGLFIGLPFIISLLTGNLAHFSWLTTFRNFGIGYIWALFTFVMALLNYDHFKLFIQSGLSRKILYRARLWTLAIISLLGTLVVTSYGIIFWGASRYLSYSAYGLYSQHFGSFGLNLGSALLFGWLGYCFIGLIGMVIGSIASLLTKSQQKLTLAAIPVLGTLLLLLLIHLFSRLPENYHFDGVVQVVYFIAGHADQTGYFNPTVPLLSLVIVDGLLAAAAYPLMQRLHVK
ncbi:hypothetical protein [Lactiplantibacillus daowaiensis]|uniref:ABC transporter permease n=1 Tax=Lactiplantibacillus daowaiensis TaxID=2559918 RepID=A0ABW1S3A7_9LACO|nr:hypothetical protein [Lactiplantibacillus daowaiensis]